jgi:hypothetical protein
VRDGPTLGIAAPGDGALDDALGALARPSANTTSRATPAPRTIRSHRIDPTAAARVCCAGAGHG